MRFRFHTPNLSSRVLSTGLVSAGVFAAVLGATGATAQEATPTATATATPAAAALMAEPTPAATTAPIPEASPTVASTPAATPAATAEATPTAAAPEPSPTSTATPAATPDAARPAKGKRSAGKRKKSRPAKKTKRSHAKSRKRSRKARSKSRKEAAARERAEQCEQDPVAELEEDAAEAGLGGQSAATLADDFPAEPATETDADAEADADADEKKDDEDSTSASRCESEKDGRKKKKRKKGKRSKRDKHDDHPPVTAPTVPTTNADGSPADGNPDFALAAPGAARIGVPNFFIEKFRIPPFLLPIYQAAGIQYGIRWELLAAINEIETDYGRNLNVSSAGALGWMQFMPATWKAYGVDANKDGLKDPYNPVDAIFAAARYLRAAGGERDIRRAVFAYNHADWYVDSVLMRARVIGGLPVDFVGSLTGLTQGRFPVHAKATYAGAIDTDKKGKKVTQGNAANVVASTGDRRGIEVFAKKGSPVIAVNDGRIVRIGVSPRLGRFVQLQDVYGNTYTYGHLGKVAETYPSPRQRKVSAAKVRRELDLPRDSRPTRAASAGRTRPAAGKPAAARN
ncbi:MAG: lytic murein transglycosylase, partial [Actinomycetota bacterium]|nr:lytic murein transglycosylase [Actinomycetota bacterium]